MRSLVFHSGLHNGSLGASTEHTCSVVSASHRHKFYLWHEIGEWAGILHQSVAFLVPDCNRRSHRFATFVSHCEQIIAGPTNRKEQSKGK